MWFRSTTRTFLNLLFHTNQVFQTVIPLVFFKFLIIRIAKITGRQQDMTSIISGSFLLISTTVFLFFFFVFLGTSVMSIDDVANSKLHPSIVMPREELVQVAGYGEEKLSSVLVAGTLLCDSCKRRQRGSVEVLTSSIAGALVGVTCRITGGKRSKMVSLARGRTDEYGDFIIDLPSHLHATPKLQESCMVRILRTPETSPCGRNDLHGRSRKMILSSVGNGIRTYTTGIIRLQRRLVSSSICMKTLGEYYTSHIDRLW